MYKHIQCNMYMYMLIHTHAHTHTHTCTHTHAHTHAHSHTCTHTHTRTHTHTHTELPPEIVELRNLEYLNLFNNHLEVHVHIIYSACTCTATCPPSKPHASLYPTMTAGPTKYCQCSTSLTRTESCVSYICTFQSLLRSSSALLSTHVHVHEYIVCRCTV